MLTHLLLLCSSTSTLYLKTEKIRCSLHITNLSGFSTASVQICTVVFITSGQLLQCRPSQRLMINLSMIAPFYWEVVKATVHIFPSAIICFIQI